MHVDIIFEAVQAAAALYIAYKLTSYERPQRGDIHSFASEYVVNPEPHAHECYEPVAHVEPGPHDAYKPAAEPAQPNRGLVEVLCHTHDGWCHHSWVRRGSTAEHNAYITPGFALRSAGHNMNIEYGNQTDG